MFTFMKNLHWLLFISVLLSSASYALIFEDGSFSLDGMYRSSYDSNVLRYSERDFKRAENGTEKYISPVKTLDDYRSDFRLTGAYRFDLMGALDSRLQLTVNFAHYLQNPINNAYWLSFIYKQEIVRKWDFLFNYFYEPYYFLRDYYDIHTGDRRHTDFSLEKAKGKLYYRPVKLIEIVGFYEFKRYVYNEYFTEYDGDRQEIGGEGIIRKGPWRIAFSYGFGWFDNVGFNEDFLYVGDLEEDSENGDGSYEEDVFSLSVYYSTRIFDKRSRVKLNLNFEKRCYTTDRNPQIDPIHHARRDFLYMPKASIEMKLNRSVSIEFGGNYYNRDSEGSLPIVSDIKNYSRFVGWFEIGYEFF